jgi:oligosaccharide repeat unit polymerase
MTNSTAAASVVMIFGLALTYLFLPDGGSVAIYRTAAIGAALAIGLGMFLEAQRVRSLVRTDLIMIVALFGLTLVEFFFPQEAVEEMVSAQSATHGVEALFLGFCGLIIGRHFVSQRPVEASAMFVEWSSATLFRIYILLLFFGYINMLWAVGFDPVELVKQMLRPRFSQPWERGRLGGVWEFVSEFSKLLVYLIPAVAGAVLAKPYRFTHLQKAVVALGLLFTLFHGFSSGTRNVFCIYLAIFLASYVLVRPHISWKRVIVLSCVVLGLVSFASYYMLQFRKVGLGGYVEGRQAGFKEETLFIDNNLPTISRLTEVFPDRADYLGWEPVFFAILRPVPRVLWPSKPEKLSMSAEDALNVRGLTLSSTFVGEAYMMGGYLAVVVVGLLFGWLASWWNRFGSDLRSNANLILYASGFFAALISMRSTIWLTTAMLPTAAIWLYMKKGRPRVQRSVQSVGRRTKS